MNDSTETRMKQTGLSPEDESRLFQLDIGSNCFLVDKTNKQHLLVHIRKYERNGDGRLYPTKMCIALNLEKWKKFSDCVNEEMDKILETYRENQPVDFKFHLGDGYYVSVKSGHPLANIRHWFVPPDQQELKPTCTGVKTVAFTHAWYE